MEERNLIKEINDLTGEIIALEKEEKHYCDQRYEKEIKQKKLIRELYAASQHTERV